MRRNNSPKTLHEHLPPYVNQSLEKQRPRQQLGFELKALCTGRGWQNAWLPAVGHRSGTARAASAAAGAWAPARQQSPPCMQQLQPPAGLRPPPGTCHGRREAGEQLDACLLLHHASDMCRDKRTALFPWSPGICHGCMKLASSLLYIYGSTCITTSGQYIHGRLAPAWLQGSA